MMTESDMIRLLQQKYTRVRAGTNADRYVRAKHVRHPKKMCDGNTYGAAAAIADYLVFDTYGQGELIGFEIKVSRSDLLTELRNPGKAEHWKQHCHRWYLVVPDKQIVGAALPEEWGLISTSKTGQLRAVRTAPKLESKPMSDQVLAQYVRAIAQTTRWELVGESLPHS